MAVIYSKARKPARASVTVKERGATAPRPKTTPAGKKEKKDGKEKKDEKTDK